MGTRGGIEQAGAVEGICGVYMIGEDIEAKGMHDELRVLDQ